VADSPEEVAALVGREVAAIEDLEVREALERFLVLPQRHMRNWDYGAAGEQYACWTVALDERSDTALLYSEHGHGPGSPWGLVRASGELWFGMDCGWFLRLEDAFVDSSVGSDLPIWNVVERAEGQARRVVLASVPLEEAYAKRDELAQGERDRRWWVEYRSRPDGIP
jgi:hypothetical protein